MAFAQFSSHVVEYGTEETELGRWSWILVGLGEPKMRVVVAYNPCEQGPNSKGSTVFKQQQSFLSN